MANSTNIQLSNTIDSIMAEHPTLTVKDIKPFFIKNGGRVIFPVLDENGQARLAYKSFTNQEVLDARAVKKAAKIEAKAQRDAAKAQAKAEAAQAKAQAKLAEAQAKVAAAQALVNGTATPASGESVTVISSSAV